MFAVFWALSISLLFDFFPTLLLSTLDGFRRSQQAVVLVSYRMRKHAISNQTICPKIAPNTYSYSDI